MELFCLFNRRKNGIFDYCVIINLKNIPLPFLILLGKPSTPVGPMEISDLDKTTVTLTWQPPTSDGGSPLTAYVIERREAARSQWTKLDSTLPADTTLTTRNLIEGNEYYFRVCAENKHGRSDWLETEQSVKMRSPFGKC